MFKKTIEITNERIEEYMHNDGDSSSCINCGDSVFSSDMGDGLADEGTRGYTGVSNGKVFNYAMCGSCYGER